MFYVINIAKPRKYVQNKVLGKYDEVILYYKLYPEKLKTPLIIMSVVCLIFVLGTTAHAAGIDPTQYKEVLDHYINDLHYPREYAEKTVGRLKEKELEELYNSIEHHKVFTNNVKWYWSIWNKIIN